MSKKTHTTANGMPFDMAAFRSKNEKVRAVGNMGVNARGDILDSNNNIIQSRTNVVNRMYEKTTQSNPTDSKKQKSISPDETTAGELNDLDDHLPNPKK